MAFALRNLSVLAYANGFTLWHYKAAADDSALTRRPEFFSGAGDMLSAGDIIIVSSPDAGRVLCVTPGVGGVATAPLG